MATNLMGSMKDVIADTKIPDTDGVTVAQVLKAGLNEPNENWSTEETLKAIVNNIMGLLEDEGLLVPDEYDTKTDYSTYWNKE